MSSWKDVNSGKYYNHVKPSYNPVEIQGWKLTIEDTIDEIADWFWFEDDSEGGTGSTTFFGVGCLKDRGDRIEFLFYITYNIFGVLGNSDEFYLSEPDRGLDRENGVQIVLQNSNCSEDYADEILEDLFEDLGDELVKIVSDNLDMFGYGL